VINVKFILIFLTIGYCSFAISDDYDHALSTLKKGEYLKSLEMFKEVHRKKGDDRAQYWIGYIYYYGQGLQREYITAAHWFNKSAEQNNREAIYMLANMHSTGKGVVKNSKLAVKLYTRAAELGLPESQWVLGDLYYRGLGVEQDHNLSFQWYLKAAEQGNAQSQYNVGLALYLGRGVDIDYPRALHWFEMAAQKNVLAAIDALANIYYDGKHLKQDFKKAFGFFERLAISGDSLAQSRIAKMYGSGIGVDSNQEQANYWYKLASGLPESFTVDFDISCTKMLNYVNSKNLKHNSKDITIFNFIEELPGAPKNTTFKYMTLLFRSVNTQYSWLADPKSEGVNFKKFGEDVQCYTEVNGKRSVLTSRRYLGHILDPTRNNFTIPGVVFSADIETSPGVKREIRVNGEELQYTH